MNSKTVLAVVMAMSMTMGDFAYAERNDRQNERGRNEESQRGNQGNGRGNGGDHERRDQRDNDTRGYQDARRGPGAGPNHDIYRGQRLSNEYRHRNYVVDDWHDHRLSAPPRGYHWVQTGGSDYLLVAIASGIIAQVLLSH